jgi:hypothetical protein
MPNVLDAPAFAYQLAWIGVAALCGCYTAITIAFHWSSERTVGVDQVSLSKFMGSRRWIKHGGGVKGLAGDNLQAHHLFAREPTQKTSTRYERRCPGYFDRSYFSGF